MIYRITVREAFERRLAHYRNRVAVAGIEAVALQLRKQGYSVEQAAAILASEQSPVEFKVPLRDVVRSLLMACDIDIVPGKIADGAVCGPGPLRYSTVREVDERGFVKITQLDEHGRPVLHKETP